MNTVAIYKDAITEQPDDLLYEMYGRFSIKGPMPYPNVKVDCAVGLEYLSQVNEVIILHESDRDKDQMYEGPSKFILINNNNEQMYTAKEECSTWKRELCYSSRPMRLKIISNSGHEVMVLNRPLRGSDCCCNFCTFCFCCTCCFQNVEVMAPIGKVIGYIQEEKQCRKEKFIIKNAAEDIMFTIMGPRKSFCFNYENELNILTANSQIQVGTIKKDFVREMHELNINIHKIQLKFAVDVDVNSKALLLAATFLMVFLTVFCAKVYIISLS
ncbi:Phospholipid scramblase 2-like protein [Leptotrombidium deliense]|uniref:Phospholipid scramblase n=1 Tax=Leptotrombidium deliense TaxID=299467 RepID=A0A443SQ07_9ACAR|nr:Phospholipid scramblase 2-like protein [Leptotrombidium deliense]